MSEVQVKAAVCHPERAVFARGMCQACYQRPYIQRHRERKRAALAAGTGSGSPGELERKGTELKGASVALG